MNLRWRTPLPVAGLLLALLVQLAIYVSRQSQTWDEGDPEHPPLAKMLAAVPLLGMDLRVPALQGRDFKRGC